MSYNPDFAIPPGYGIKEALEFENISLNTFSKKTGLSKSYLLLLIEGRTPITEEIAILLEKKLGIPISFWLNLEKNYQRIKKNIEENKYKKIDLKGNSL